MKIYFIGNPRLSCGYRLLGVQCFSVSTKEEFLKTLEEVLKFDDVGIILLDSDFSSMVSDYIYKLKVKRALPFIIEVPGLKTTPKMEIKSILSKSMGVGF